MKIKLLCAVVAVGLVLLGGTMFASNMGFKIVKPVNLESGSNINIIGLPYNFPDVDGDGDVDADDVAQDMGGIGVGVSEVAKWDAVNQAWISWLGGRSTNFALTPGEGLLVKVPADLNYVIVGSHDPSVTVTVDLQAGSNISMIAVPYHSMSTTADDVANEFGGIGVGVSEVSKWDATNQAWISWLGGRSTNFALTPGEGLLVKVPAQVVWSPSHY